MLKLKTKKKTTKGVILAKPQPVAKKLLERPEWNSTHSDLDKYKLSKVELAQKRISHISKHRYEAKELWLQRQEKLKKGIIDEETQSIMETCLSNKRQPERNTKNLTYFIKDEHYDSQYQGDYTEEAESDDLTMNDLHYERNKEKETESTTRSSFVEKKNNVKVPVEKISKVQEDDGGDDFIKKVNQSLKDARDLMSKIERYPSIVKSKDPEKALVALTNLEKEKENKARHLSTTATTTKQISKTQQQKQMKPLESNLRKSNGFNQTSQSNGSNGFGNKSTVTHASPKLKITQPKIMKQVEEEEYVLEDSPREDQEDISQYFKSLNQIEDTIKFLENNIIGGGGNGKEETKVEKVQRKEPEMAQKSLNPINLDAFLGKTSSEILRSPSPVKSDHEEEKVEESSPVNDYFAKRLLQQDEYHNSEDENKSQKDEHEEEEEQREEEEEEEEDEEQISFALTMRSTEQNERRPEQGNYASGLFGFDEMSRPSVERPKQISMHQQNSPPAAYPKVIFENKPLYEKSVNQSLQSIKPQRLPEEEEEEYPRRNGQTKEEGDDEEDLEIERIKKLLQSTKMEIEKMNTNHSDIYNSSFKGPLDVLNKENSPKTSFNTRTLDSKVDSFFGKEQIAMKHDPVITVKQSSNPVWETSRRILGEIGNKFDNKSHLHDDDDIPMPQTLKIDRQIVTRSSPKKTAVVTDDDSFNFRSFRKK